MNHAFHPGQPWLDTEGKRIQAHGGSVLFHEGTYYWYGEDKTRTTPGSGIWHMGVRLYASTDLYNWVDCGTILAPEDDPASPLHTSRIMDRPHMLYNKRTKRFVLWVKFAGSTAAPGDWRDQSMGVYQSESIRGPFTPVRTLHPLGMNSGDFDLFTDAADGKGYIIFDRVHSEVVVADLTADYTDVTGFYSCHLPHEHPPMAREAPAVFQRRNRFYLLTSGTTGYFPNPSESAMSLLIHGPWQEQGDLHPTDGYHTSFDSQICSVFRHPTCKELYIALADRWLTDLPRERPDIAGHFNAEFSGDANVLANLTSLDGLSRNDTSVADYVWLPVRFEGDRAVIAWQDEWRWEDWQ